MDGFKILQMLTLVTLLMLGYPRLFYCTVQYICNMYMGDFEGDWEPSSRIWDDKVQVVFV